MKPMWMVFAVFLLITGFVQAEMRVFQLKDGRALEAEVVGFNSKLGKVELKRADGKRVKVKSDIFIEENQEYIRSWVTLNNFKSDSMLKVDCSKKKVEQWKEEDSAFQTKFERYVYEIELQNRGKMPLKKLTLEYRIFYEQEANDHATKKVITKKLNKPGSIDIAQIEPNKKKKVSTESIVLEEFQFNMSDYYVPDGDPETTRGEIKGIWIKLSMKTSEGDTITRDIFEPSSLEGKYRW